jgi:hypothetical protein
MFWIGQFVIEEARMLGPTRAGFNQARTLETSTSLIQPQAHLRPLKHALSVYIYFWKHLSHGCRFCRVPT